MQERQAIVSATTQTKSFGIHRPNLYVFWEPDRKTYVALHLSLLLKRQTPEYLNWFSPFATYEEQDLENTLYNLPVCEVLDEYNYQVYGFWFLRDQTEREAELGVLVDESWAGRGIGKLLLQHVRVTAGVNGLSSLWAAVHPANQRSQRLFRSAGWTLTDRIVAGQNVFEVQINRVEPDDR